VIRATNTGISSVALASGEILKRSPLHREWSGRFRVSYLDQPVATIYQHWSWLVPGLLWFSLAILLGFGLWIRRQRTRD
ncbi:MAG: apolipoprotein N-acyltransferase, partial [Methylococcales bacterium]